MNTRWVVAAAAAVGLAVVAIAGLGIRSSESVAGEAAGSCDPAAKPANFNFTLDDVNGNPVKLSSFKGKVLVIDFWATWCGPCKIEIPWFIEFQKKYGARGFTVVGISSDDKPEQLRPFVAEFKMNYPVLQGLGRDDVHDAFGPIWGLPTTYIVGRDGRICKKHMGLAPKEQFEKEILGLL
ncbi:MAG: TlpA disulfide reductase family protein [Acidobacteria bacterium]|nr:TlpA disulfide reductase family protein [Acidobacteriota bacterium]